jgi:hypothetical protein
MDGFFLEGPKFLFWIAVAILKVNEPALINQGKDDDIFGAVLKDFFARLSINSHSGESNDTEEIATGPALMKQLLHEAFNVIGPLITNENIESLRMTYRLKVVHQMESTSRKSQIRTLSEQVSLTMEELGIIFDVARQYEFLRGDEEEDPNGVLAQSSKEEFELEENTKDELAKKGGWGLVRKYIRQKSARNAYQKSIRISDFKKIFRLVSPFKGTEASSDKTIEEMPIIDRIYYYCCFQYNFVQKQKAASNISTSEIGYFVDLTALTHVLDALTKQPLNSRLRFIFDLYDIDGDGNLNNAELKALMDAFLEMFQHSRNARSMEQKDEEKYLRAVSSFLSASLKMGSNNEQQPSSFRLSFNEFLLAVLSQSVFVEYFERKWTISQQGGIIVVSYTVTKT